MKKQSDQVQQEPQQSNLPPSDPANPPRRAGSDDTIILLATYIYDVLGRDMGQAEKTPDEG